MKKSIKILGLLAVALAMTFALNSFSTPKGNPQNAGINGVTTSNYSAKVHIKLSNGNEVYCGSFEAYCKGFLGGWVKFKTDAHGYATIKWTSDHGEIIDHIILHGDGVYKSREKKGLNIKDGGSYEIVMDD